MRFTASAQIRNRNIITALVLSKLATRSIENYKIRVVLRGRAA